MLPRRLQMVELVTVEPLVLGGFQRRVPFAERLERIPEAFAELGRRQKAAGLLFAGPETALYRMVGNDVKVTLGVPMDDLFPGFEPIGMPGGRALWHRHRGPFAGLADVYPMLHREAERMELQVTGMTREIYRIVARDPKRNVCDVYMDVADN